MFTGVWLAGLVLPLIHLTTGLLAPADYLLPDWATAAGAALQIPVLWLFWRSHADLGGTGAWSEVARATASSPTASTPLSAIPCTSRLRCRRCPSPCSSTTGSPGSSRSQPSSPCVSFASLSRRRCCASIWCCLRRLCRPHAADLPRSITPARKFRMLLHTNPMCERGECLGTRAGALEDM